MNILRISAFADGHLGGNPAGVVLTSKLPSTETMQAVAAEVGFSETVFAAMLSNDNSWRVRYFSPESEVPFCGHATIALGAALTERYGENKYALSLNESEISVTGKESQGNYSATLLSPRTSHEPLDRSDVEQTLNLFNYEIEQVDQSIPPARINAGANHYVVALKSRSDLSSMHYTLDEGRDFMNSHNVVTVMFVSRSQEGNYHARNAFASGGVLEDPATGAAAAAFSGYLRDAQITRDQNLTIIQGEDMGSKSIIYAKVDPEIGSPISISGATRRLD